MHLITLALGCMLLTEAAALRCYTCNQTDLITTNDDCTKTQQCPPSMFGMLAWECMTHKAEGVNPAASSSVKTGSPEEKFIKMKGCIGAALGLSMCSLAVGLPEAPYCCDHDLCNAASRSALSSALLFLLAPLLCVLLLQAH